MLLTLTKSTIRSFRSADAASLQRHLGAYSVARNMCAVPHPYALEDAEDWIAYASERVPETHFGITIGDEVIGGIGVDAGECGRFTVSAHCAEIGYWLGESYWGRGIMSEALAAVTEWAFTDLGLIRLQAAVFARNPVSARVLEKAGYHLEGRGRARYFRDGEFIDGLLYAKVRLPG